MLYPVEPDGFDVLPAASGVPELTEMTPDMRQLLLQRLEPALGNYDYVFMDLGAGISETVQTFAAVAAARIVIITPEPTSLTDSYALIKVLNNRFGMRDFMILVNQVASAKEAQASFEKLDGACRHFLHLEPVLLGHVRTDNKLPAGRVPPAAADALCAGLPRGPGPAIPGRPPATCAPEHGRLGWPHARSCRPCAVVCAANSIPVQPGRRALFQQARRTTRARPHCRQLSPSWNIAATVTQKSAQ